MTISDDDWGRRILCSDGNCIGIIGADGHCNECGKPYEGDLPLPATDAEAAAEGVAVSPPDEDGQTDNANPPADEQTNDDDQAGDDDWENRVLCVDESCIGVIGPDGRCKECGKPNTK